MNKRRKIVKPSFLKQAKDMERLRKVDTVLQFILEGKVKSVHPFKLDKVQRMALAEEISVRSGTKENSEVVLKNLGFKEDEIKLLFNKTRAFKP